MAAARQAAAGMRGGALVVPGWATAPVAGATGGTTDAAAPGCGTAAEGGRDGLARLVSNARQGTNE